MCHGIDLVTMTDYPTNENFFGYVGNLPPSRRSARIFQSVTDLVGQGHERAAVPVLRVLKCLEQRGRALPGVGLVYSRASAGELS
jgi:hypothetical protein